MLSAIRKERRREVAEGGYAYGLDPAAKVAAGNSVELRRARAEHHPDELTNALSAPAAAIEGQLDATRRRGGAGRCEDRLG